MFSSNPYQHICQAAANKKDRRAVLRVGDYASSPLVSPWHLAGLSDLQLSHSIYKGVGTAHLGRFHWFLAEWVRPGRSNLPVTLNASLGVDSDLPPAQSRRLQGVSSNPSPALPRAKTETRKARQARKAPSTCQPVQLVFIVACFWRRQSEDWIKSSRPAHQGRMPSFPPPVTAARSAYCLCRSITCLSGRQRHAARGGGLF